MDASSAVNARWAMFVEAKKDDTRIQWIVFSPFSTNLFDAEGKSPAFLAERADTARVIRRTLRHVGNRARWETIPLPASVMGDRVSSELHTYAGLSWEILTPVVVQVDGSDYHRVYADSSVNTPYKVIRHIEAITTKRGYLVNAKELGAEGAPAAV